MAPLSGRGKPLKRWLLRIGRFQSAVLLTLIYLLLWLPAGLLARLLADWLRLRSPAQTNWQPRPDRVNQPESIREQF